MVEIIIFFVIGALARGVIIWFKNRKEKRNGIENTSRIKVSLRLSTVIENNARVFYKIGICLQVSFILASLVIANELVFDDFFYGLYAFIALSSPVWFLWMFRWLRSQHTIVIAAFPLFLLVSFLISGFVFSTFSEWYDNTNGGITIFSVTLSPVVFLLLSYFNNICALEEKLSSTFWNQPIRLTIVKNFTVIAIASALILMGILGWFN